MHGIRQQAAIRLQALEHGETEGCQEGGPHLGSWELGERYARSMINDLNRWTVDWIDWNLILNEQGGPDHVGNFCSAPIMIDREHDALMYQSSYFYTLPDENEYLGQPKSLG